jgi:copper transport protein
MGTRRPLSHRLLRAATSATIAAVVALAIAALLPGATASAAPQLDGENTIPAPDSKLQTSPTALQLVFTEELSEAPTVVMQNSQRQPIELGDVGRGDDDTIWVVDVLTPLPRDTYKVTISGSATASFSFSVVGGAAPSATTTVAGGTTVPGSSTTVPPSGTQSDGSDRRLAKTVSWVGRFMSYLGLGSLLGGLLLIVLAWQEGVEYVLTVRFFRAVWFIGLIGALLSVIALAAVHKGQSVTSSLSPGDWFDLKDTTPGLAALARLVFTAACGWVVFAPERVVDAATQIPALAFPVLAVASFGFSRTGGNVEALGVIAGILHAFSFAAWFGGLALLVRVTLAGPGDSDLVQAVRGFSRIAAPALIVVVFTGAIQTARLVGGAGKLLSTGFGRILLLKAIVVAVMAYMGTVNRHTVRARLARANQLTDRAAFRLRRAIGSEALAGVITLALTAWMLNSVPSGVNEPAVGGTNGPSAQTIVVKDDTLDVTVGIDPSRVGENRLTISVDKPTTDLVDLDLKFFPVNGGAPGVDIPVRSEQVSNGKKYVIEKVPFGVADRWTITVTGTQTSGVALGPLSRSFVIADENGDEPEITTPPTTTVPATTTAPATTAPPTSAG